MRNLNLTDETFDVNQSGNYFLSMQSCLTGFSYAIYDTVRNKCILLKHFDTKSRDWSEYTNFLTSVINNDDNLKLSFKGIHHVICQQHFTIVPEVYLQKDDREAEMFFPGSDISTKSLVNSSSVISKATIISPYPEELITVLKERFKEIRLSHHTLPFIHNLIFESSRSLRHVFHLLVHDNFITIGVAHSKSLDFVNTFKSDTIEDIIFFTLSVLETFKTSPSSAEVHIINESSISDISTKLQAYIGKVRYMKPPQNTVYSYVITEDILEHFSNLLNIYHCE